MKGLGKLVGNENKKVWKQTGLRVILIIIAALTALSPVFNFLASRALNYEGYGNYMYDPDNIQSQLEYAQENGDVLTEKYWRVYESTVNFFEKNGIVSEWQIYFFRDDYAQALGWLTIVETVAPGGFTAEDITNSMLTDFIYEHMREDESLSELEPENISRTLADARKALAELENDILSFTLGDYYASRLADAEAERDKRAATLEAYQNGTLGLGVSGSSQLDAEYTKYMCENAERALEAAELSVWGWQQLTENLYEYGSWQYNTVNKMIARMNVSGDFGAIASEELFNSREYGESLRYSYETYEQYEKEMHSCSKQWDESKALVLYSLEHGIPLRGTVKGDAYLRGQLNARKSCDIHDNPCGHDAFQRVHLRHDKTSAYPSAKPLKDSFLKAYISLCLVACRRGSRRVAAWRRMYAPVRNKGYVQARPVHYRRTRRRDPLTYHTYHKDTAGGALGVSDSAVRTAHIHSDKESRASYRAFNDGSLRHLCRDHAVRGAEPDIPAYSF